MAAGEFQIAPSSADCGRGIQGRLRVTSEILKMNICYKCIGDGYLQGEIKSEGKRRACSFCGKHRKSYRLEELAQRVEGVIEENYIPHQDEYGADSGEPIGDLIADLINVGRPIAEAVRAELSSGTAYLAAKNGETDPFDSETCYIWRKADTYDYQESWRFFRNEISRRSRYFSEHARQSLLKIFGDISGMRVWPDDPVKSLTKKAHHRFAFCCWMTKCCNAYPHDCHNGDPIRRPGSCDPGPPAGAHWLRGRGT